MIELPDLEAWQEVEARNIRHIIVDEVLYLRVGLKHKDVAISSSGKSFLVGSTRFPEPLARDTERNSARTFNLQVCRTRKSGERLVD